MKKFRLLLAKWALAPVKINIDDVSFVIGDDIRGVIRQDANKEFETQLKSKVQEYAQNLAANELAGLDTLGPKVLVKIIEMSKTLPEDKKIGLLGILDDVTKPDIYR